MARPLLVLVALVVSLAACDVRADAPPPWSRADAQVAVELLSAAGTHGLDPRDYAVGAGAGDDALTDAMQRYLSDLHRGRVDPRRLHHDFDVAPRGDFDAAAVLREALASHRLRDAVDAAAPQLPLYARLREALAFHRALGDHAAWRQPLPPLPARARKVEPGQAYAGVPLLAQRLSALGDLPPVNVDTTRYEGALVAAVTGFQERHGLAADGVIGRATLASLQVTPAARARQIELALERLRWTPLMQGPRMIVVNIPEFVLRAYEVHDGRISVRQEMKVIVGQAMDRRTPLFDEEMRFIEFAPYWNVPPSIARKELVPRLRRDPGYFSREGFEFVGPGGVDTTLSSARLDGVMAGAWRIRQRPGDRNALGDIKFVFPNRDNIYLHHTPATALFGRDRRDFSHGCIRVEQPVALASFVMEGMPGWDEARIREAMGEGRSNTVRLARPVPVLIAYGTALVKGGRVHFFDDVYGHDRVLDQALRERSLHRNVETPP